MNPVAVQAAWAELTPPKTAPASRMPANICRRFIFCLPKIKIEAECLYTY
jgi:hypothetical protein